MENTRIACTKCKLLFRPIWLKDGICAGCRNPNLIIKGVHKSSNCVFSPDTLKSYSYDWWLMSDKINGKVIFNNYGYSATTRIHQRNVLRVLNQLGIKVDYFISAPKGLQSPSSAIQYYESKINELLAEIAKPKSHTKKNETRLVAVEAFKRDIQLVKKLYKL